MALVKVIEEYGGPGLITHFPNMIKKELELKNPGVDMSKAMPDQMKEAKKTVREKNLAALMLNGANGQKYGELKRGMAENYVTGPSEYPESTERWCFVFSLRKSCLLDGTSIDKMQEQQAKRGQCSPKQRETIGRQM